LPSSSAFPDAALPAVGPKSPGRKPARRDCISNTYGMIFNSELTTRAAKAKAKRFAWRIAGHGFPMTRETFSA